MSKTKLIVLIIAIVAIGAFLLFGPRHYLSLEFMQSQLGRINEYREANPITSVLLFAAVYITATAASIPGALVLTLLGGAIFGFWLGSLVVVISATIGATIAFLLARYLFDDFVQQKFGDKLKPIRENFRKEGAMYLFSMRLVPVFPFFAVNLLMGLTSIKTSTYAIASLIGMAPGTMVFINAGTQLAKLESLKGLLSPAMIASFVLLAVFPYIAKYFMQWIKSRRTQSHIA
ncbi:MAG: TVP38/TMEM64 family protein [Acidiferrobacterales bacterium]|nr:TVP38/TMEM64 family protein [Acidiferrobacterales bacterium]